MTTEELAKAGDVQAQLQLGIELAARGQIPASRGWLANAAKHGSAEAMRRLALNLLIEDPIEDFKGVNMMRAAAAKGDAMAARFCGLLAAGDEALPNRWDVARECFRIAADRGLDLARDELAILERANFEAPLRPRALYDFPRIFAVENFASPEECDWVMAQAKPRLQRAEVYDPRAGGGVQVDARTNSAVTLDIGFIDIATMMMRQRIAKIIGRGALEAASVLHYDVGEEFRPHFDFLDPALSGHVADLRANGQRIATFLVYLNEDYEGGETAFPRLSWRFRGRKGDALLFWNVDAKGEPDRQTFHAGLSPTHGEKWLLSQWIREKR